MVNKQQEKIIEALKFEQAIKDKKEAWILLAKLNNIVDKIENINPSDLSDIKKSISDLQEKINEDFEIELSIE